MKRTTVIDFGPLVRERRKAIGLTQADVAKRIGLSRPSVANIEGGHQNPTLGVILMFMKALGIKKWTIVA